MRAVNGRAALALLLALTLVLLPGCGKKKPAIPDPPEAFFVLDEADVLTDETEAWIVSHNKTLPQGAQIVVVCVPNTGALTIDDYAKQLFNTWKIGDATKKNGVLILLSIGAEDYWVTQGTGLEDLLPSGQIKLILNESLEPDFAAGRYDAGVRAVFEALSIRLSQIYGVAS